MADLVGRLRNIAEAKAASNRDAGRKGRQWAREAEVEWNAADRITILEAEAHENARLLGMGGEREANMAGEIERLKRRIAALEAEASKGERRGLERAAQVARNFAKEPARKLLAKNMNGRWPVTAEPLARQALRLEKAIRALIPEAPVREASHEPR